MKTGLRIKKMDDFCFKGKRVLVRADINSDVVDGKVIISERIKATAGTLKELKRAGAKIVVLGHQGRPGKNDFTSLKRHAKLLNKYVKVNFVDDVVGEKALKKINKLKRGEILLLENVRGVKDEFMPDKKKNILIEKLAPLFDYYVNDAFSVCHRKQTSITEFPKYLRSCMGKVMETELSALKKINLKNSLLILGGSKAEDNIKLLKKSKGKIIVCGIFGQLCVIAKGKNLGAQNKFLKKDLKVIPELKKTLRGKKILMPLDFAIDAKGNRVEKDIEDFPCKFEIYDIGKRSIDLFRGEIAKAKSVYMKGPAGYCEDKDFCKGTFSILEALSRAKGFSLIGGGHLSNALERSKIKKNKFGHVSLSGGALITWLAGENLVGVEALKKGAIKNK